MRRHCSECIYCDQCFDNETCGFFEPIDEEIDLSNIIENNFIEFIKDWNLYIENNMF